MRDLDIRGAGNLLGAEQSGFISDIGYETYQKILAEAVQELKESEYRELFREELAKDPKFVRDVAIDTDVEMLIPDDYVNSIDERLRLYTELDQLENESDLSGYAERMEDRFGPIPKVVEELFEGLRIRWMCKKMGFYRFVLKNRKMMCFFVQNAQSVYYESAYFKQLLGAVSSLSPKGTIRLKQSKNHLILIQEKTSSLQHAHENLIALNKIAIEQGQTTEV
jgi:transcription-repair coupling factor (superfamily II helicase)